MSHSIPTVTARLKRTDLGGRHGIWGASIAFSREVSETKPALGPGVREMLTGRTDGGGPHGVRLVHVDFRGERFVLAVGSRMLGFWRYCCTHR